MRKAPPRISRMPANRPSVLRRCSATPLTARSPVRTRYGRGRRFALHIARAQQGRGMPKILAIEDDATTGKEIVAELEGHGFAVEWVADGHDGMARALSGEFDAVILDRLRPRVDGLAIVTAMRGAEIDVPVLMISALSDVDERIRGLRAGGDDYMAKPFASEEMTARLEVLLRQRAAAQQPLNLSVADLDLDLITRTAHRGGEEIRLMPTEVQLH